MRARGIVLAGSVLVAGCESRADPRAQLIVFVDTDAPAPAQLAARPDLSGDAAVDTLRVDAFAEGWGKPFDLRDFIAPDPSGWPISFGVATDEVPLDRPVHLRLRAFRGRFATRGELDGVATIDPPREVTIDRLVEIDPSRDGVRRVRVTLRASCFGVHSVFDPAAPTTCTGSDRAAAPSADVDEIGDADPPTEVGTFADAVEVPCAGAAPEGALCVPGGFTILGEAAFEGVGDGYYDLDPIPLRPVLVSPFHLDRTEVTVGRFRELLNDGKFSGVMPISRDDPSIDDSGFCSFIDTQTASSDALPLNCVGRPTAEAVCAALGGVLPSEAQWEHAARGRGRRTLYPWGDHTPNGEADCCIASASRKGPPSIPVECPGSGLEPAGSHPNSPGCGGLGDVSRDGILDLAGSLSEVLRDSLERYDADCWTVKGGGVLRDPLCQTDSVLFAARGGNWNAGQARTAAPFRGSFTAGTPVAGFRCAYPGGG